MFQPLAAIAIFVTVFVTASLRNVHLGVLMFPAACAVGVWVAGMPLKDVVGGFPINLLVLLAGVTYFFGIAQANGTVDRLIGGVLARVGPRPQVLPFVFFALAGGVSAMGSPISGLVVAPVGMPIARRAGIDPVLMALAINAGICAGAFSPTSLFGIVSYGAARQAGIDLSPFTLLLVSMVANLALLLVAIVLFGRQRAVAAEAPLPMQTTNADLGLRTTHIVSVVCMAGLVASVIICAIYGIEPDIGVTAFAFAAALTLIDPESSAKAVARIDWSTVLMVGGIITFVGVLQKLGAVNLLSNAATHIGAPLMAAVVICLIAGLVSAFASTTGILAALVPMAVPLATSGEVAGWAIICALGVCASIVDISPFSTTGATLIASAAEHDRPRMRSLLMRWGMSMVAVGPVVLVPILVLVSRFL